MQNISMLAGLFDLLGNLLAGFFAIIPQTLYFIYASAASILDMLQYAAKKLAGLDVYYVNGKQQYGDILTSFVEGTLGFNSNYSIFTTVFYSMVIFGVILLVFATIIAIIRAHYDYDAKKSPPMVIIGKAFKGLLTIVIVPFVTIFGMYLSEALIVSLDSITSGSNTSMLSETYESSALDKFASATRNGHKVYGGFDFFSVHNWNNGVSFSSALFLSAAYNCNRVRTGNYDTVIGENNSAWSNAGIFWTDDATDTTEKLANQIDMAFEYALTLKEGETISLLKTNAFSLATSYSGMSAMYAIGLINVKTFSKFNVGLIWYYYNLWTFDYFIGFAGIIIALILFFNVILGLISRIFTTLALFFVYPPIVALYPFDEGNAFKSWRSSFIKTYVATFSTIVAINILSIILPFLRTITLFNITLLDSIMRSLFVLAGLMFIKKAIAMFSNMIGAENLEELGGKMAKEFGDSVVKGVKAVMVMANVGMKAGNSLGESLKKNSWAKNITKGIKNKIVDKKIRKKKNLDKGTKISDQERQGFIRNEEADRLMEADRNSETTKKEHNREYRVRARNELEKNNPELFEKGKNGKKVIKKDKKAEYNRLIAEKEREIALADADENIAKNHGVKNKVKNTVMNFFYQPEEAVNKRRKKSQGKKPPERKLKNWAQGAKEGGQEFMDLAGVSLKLVGDLTGISGFGKKLKDAGVVDDFKSHVKTFGKDVLGISLNIQTSKDKEDEEKQKTKKYRSNIAEAATIMETTSSEIEKLLKSFEGYKKRQQEAEIETIRAQNEKAKKGIEAKKGDKPKK